MLLEGVRNYVFLFLFRNYCVEVIRFFEIIIQMGMVFVSEGINLDFVIMLQFVVLEIGKKVGFVEELGMLNLMCNNYIKVVNYMQCLMIMDLVICS